MKLCELSFSDGQINENGMVDEMFIENGESHNTLVLFFVVFAQRIFIVDISRHNENMLNNICGCAYYVNTKYGGIIWSID